MVLPYCKSVLTDLIAKAFTQKKVINKGADCSCIAVAALAIISQDMILKIGLVLERVSSRHI